MKASKYMVAIGFALGLGACATQPADLMLLGGKIYQVDSAWTVAEALVVRHGKVLYVGTANEAKKKYKAAQTIDLSGSYVYPGFADGHCHFLGYGRTLFNADLTDANSLQETLERLHSFFGPSTTGWIQGRGWDQNRWADLDGAYPSLHLLDSLYPNQPVALRRVDGHALWVNSKALEMAHIHGNTRIEGGEIPLDATGQVLGILIDNAMEPVLALIPENMKERDQEAMLKAQKNCLAVGLTFLHDAGLPLADVLMIDEAYRQGQLKLRIYQMIANDDEALAHFERAGPIVSDRFWVRSIKCYMDGALGSRGAWLNAPYADAPGTSGLQLTPTETMRTTLKRALGMGFQVNTHAIGDRAVAHSLELYADVLPQANDLRWRIEHCQVIDPSALPLFAAHGIIPSVQPTHATSDMAWAPHRLGTRLEGAYAYQSLLGVHGWLVGGSDFPVEQINPLLGFYAAVARQNTQGMPQGGFLPRQALSRKDALMAMTIWPARGAHLETCLGSLEPGKWADFVVLNTDLMEAPLGQIPSASVLATYINGELVFEFE
ncbi:MAG: amidohydrolase [Bacteroidetes bacterium]|nr:amidohydrolase [Bacteroidota bacterium]